MPQPEPETEPDPNNGPAPHDKIWKFDTFSDIDRDDIKMVNDKWSGYHDIGHDYSEYSSGDRDRIHRHFPTSHDPPSRYYF